MESPEFIAMIFTTDIENEINIKERCDYLNIHMERIKLSGVECFLINIEGPNMIERTKMLIGYDHNVFNKYIMQPSKEDEVELGLEPV